MTLLKKARQASSPAPELECLACFSPSLALASVHTSN